MWIFSLLQTCTAQRTFHQFHISETETHTPAFSLKDAKLKKELPSGCFTVSKQLCKSGQCLWQGAAGSTHTHRHSVHAVASAFRITSNVSLGISADIRKNDEERP